MSLRFQFHNNAMHAFVPQDIRRYFATVFNFDSAMQSMHFFTCKLRDVFTISKIRAFKFFLIAYHHNLSTQLL